MTDGDTRKKKVRFNSSVKIADTVGSDAVGGLTKGVATMQVEPSNIEQGDQRGRTTKIERLTAAAAPCEAGASQGRTEEFKPRRKRSHSCAF